MKFIEYFHKTNLLQEATDVLDQMHQVHNLIEFFNQQTKSPYILLQILAIALMTMPGFPANTIEEINADPQLLLSDNTRKKMQYFMTKTRFSNDYNLIYRTVFPDSVGNPVQWAKDHRDLSTNVQSSEIKKILDYVIHRYDNIEQIK